ncbi:hypothetical protein LSH36_103g00003 [Paralvinella palmiformis]|uniref:Aquaporin n=1 Tax=Paralvinella palmiformis TaxID=53620 RepID=A0AAD9N9R9_9ANNE|nr:hypothetical protein LSH36_103g00003 [Paralvinella palmiformis]
MCRNRWKKAVNFAEVKRRITEFAMRTRDDLRDLRFWRGVLAEFTGSVFLILVGCGSWTGRGDGPDTVRVALAFGFMYAILIYCLRRTSGAHLNPVVTIATAVTCKISAARAAIYVTSQTFGALFGASFLYAVTPEPFRGTLGCTTPQDGVSEGQGFGVEFFCTLILIFVTFACFEEHDQEEERRCPGHLIVGLAVASLSFYAVPLTGGSFNPARSFAPAIIRGIWTKHWIYWFGTVLGGIIGGTLYEVIFSRKATLSRLVTCLTTTRFGKQQESKPPGPAGPPPPDGVNVAQRRVLKSGDSAVMASVDSMPDIEDSSSSEEDNEKTSIKIA